MTLVFSPNVATYVGDGEAVISWLLTGGVASGVLIFLGNLNSLKITLISENC